MSPAPHASDHIEPPDGHPSDELAALLAGRLDLTELPSVVAHARRCATCQRDLVELAAATGALRRANRDDPPPLPSPAFLGLLVDGDADAGDLHRGPPAGQRAHRRRRVLLAVAAAVAVIVGLSAGLIATRSGQARSGPIALTAPSGGPSRGSIVMVGSGSDQTMTVSTALPAPQAGTYYEVWLLEEPTGAMVPLGVLPAPSTARYVLPSPLVAHYDAVDISLQPDNGSTQHSSDSVLRARYA